MGMTTKEDKQTVNTEAFGRQLLSSPPRGTNHAMGRHDH